MVRLFEDSDEARLSMRRQISLRVHAVVGFRNDLTIHRKERTEGVIPLAAGFLGQYKASTQQRVLVHMEQISAGPQTFTRSSRSPAGAYS